MYVVAIRRPRVHYARVRAYHNSVKIVNVDRMLTLIVAHPMAQQETRLNSQRIRAGRDLKNSLLKGRRSRLYDQWTKVANLFSGEIWAKFEIQAL